MHPLSKCVHHLLIMSFITIAAPGGRLHTFVICNPAFVYCSGCQIMLHKRMGACQEKLSSVGRVQFGRMTMTMMTDVPFLAFVCVKWPQTFFSETRWELIKIWSCFEQAAEGWWQRFRLHFAPFCCSSSRLTRVFVLMLLSPIWVKEEGKYHWGLYCYGSPPFDFLLDCFTQGSHLCSCAWSDKGVNQLSGLPFSCWEHCAVYIMLTH